MSGENILFVDDEEQIRKLITSYLQRQGYVVTVATDGYEGLKAIRAKMPDLVITDVNMPNMDGITLVRELRNRASYKFVPLLVLTTEATTERKQQGKAAGATGWLVKPFNPERLLATVAKVLG